MEPTCWSNTKFIVEAKITFSIRKAYEGMSPRSDMLAAVVLADRVCPWWDNGQAARLNVSEPQAYSDDDEVVVYGVEFQSACTLTPSQLSAYVKYAAQLAETAHRFMSCPRAVKWIGATVGFHGVSIIYDTERCPVARV